MSSVIREWTSEEAQVNNKVAVFMNMFMEASSEVKLDTAHTHDQYKRMMANGICKIYISEKEDGSVEGAIGFIISTDLHENKKIAIEAFWFVDPSCRGIGKKLFNVFEEEARKLGCVKLAMVHMVDSYPDTLKSFYEKSGYHLAELHYVKEI